MTEETWNTHKAQAMTVLEYFNIRAHRDTIMSSSELVPIISLLAGDDGQAVSVRDLKLVAAHRTLEWDKKPAPDKPDSRKWLHPSTIYGRNFSKYLAEARAYEKKVLARKQQPHFGDAKPAPVPTVSVDEGKAMAAKIRDWRENVKVAPAKPGAGTNEQSIRRVMIALMDGVGTLRKNK